MEEGSFDAPRPSACYLWSNFVLLMCPNCRPDTWTVFTNHATGRRTGYQYEQYLRYCNPRLSDHDLQLQTPIGSRISVLFCLQLPVPHHLAHLTHSSTTGIPKATGVDGYRCMFAPLSDPWILDRCWVLESEPGVSVGCHQRHNISKGPDVCMCMARSVHAANVSPGSARVERDMHLQHPATCGTASASGTCTQRKARRRESRVSSVRVGPLIGTWHMHMQSWIMDGAQGSVCLLFFRQRNCCSRRTYQTRSHDLTYQSTL